MIDNEKDFDAFDEAVNDAEDTSSAEFENKSYESTDIYSDPNVSGEEVTPVAEMEKPYEGFFKEDEEPAYADYNPYADSTMPRETNPYADASNKAESVKGEPVGPQSADNGQVPPVFNPYAAPGNGQYYNHFYAFCQ